MTKRSEDVWYAVGDEVRTYRGTLLTVNEWLTDEEAEEVARVAAAAPQMLQALEGLLAANNAVDLVLCDGPEVPDFDPMALGRAQSDVSEAEKVALIAIKKAKGEEDE